MSEFRGYFPDGVDGQIVLVESSDNAQPDAIELQKRLSEVFDEPIKFPLDPNIYHKGAQDV